MEFNYHIRVDGYDNSGNRELLTKTIERIGTCKYAIYHEVGEKTRKPHYQGIIIVEKELKDNERTNIRNWVNRHLPTDDKYHQQFYKDNKKIQRVAFTKAKKETLHAYVAKDGNLIMTNMTVEDLKEVAEWKPKQTTNDAWNKSLEAIKKYEGQTGKEQNYYYYVQKSIEEILRIHLEANKIPHKNTVLKLLYKNKQVTYYNIANSIGLGNYFF